MRIRRPIAGLTLCFIAGTYCGLVFDVSPGAVLSAAWVATLWLAIAAFRSSFRIRALPAFLAVFLVGWTGAAFHGPGGRFPPFSDSERGSVMRIVGIVADDPAIFCGSDGRRTCSFALRAEAVAQPERGGKWRGTGGRISVSLLAPAGMWTPRYGERWALEGRAARAAAGPSVRGHAARARFLSGGHGNAFLEWCYARRRAAANYLSAGIEDFPGPVGVLRAMVLGYRHELPKSLKADFTATGTIHIFAISGCHVGIITLLQIFVLQALGVPRTRWAFFLAPMLVIYAAATGMSASSVRACVMAIAFFSAPVFRRRPDALSSLALAALLILAAAPAQLSNIGFILSFSVVLGLILVTPVFDAPLARLCEPDPLRLQPETRVVVVARAVGRKLASLVALSVAAWLVSTPLTAFFFGRVSLMALLTNIVVIPLAFVIILTGCLSIVLGPLLLFFAEVFNHANLVVISAMTGLMSLSAKAPLASVEVPRPPAWIVVLWFAVLAAAVSIARRREGDRIENDGKKGDRPVLR